MQLIVKKTDPRAKELHYSSLGPFIELSVVLEFPYFLEPGERQVFSTGLSITPNGYDSKHELIIRSDSVLAAEVGLCVANSGCRYDNKLWLKNDSFKKIKLDNGMVVAELVVVPVDKAGFV